MFDRIRHAPAAGAIEPLPGWLDRRRQDLPAAEEVLAKLPTGPVTGPRQPDGRRSA